MTTFKIFTASEKFVWTRKGILFGIFLLSSALLMFKVYVIRDSDFFNDSLAQVFGFISVVAIILGLLNSFFPEELKGKLNGELILDYSKIKINDKVYELNDIQSIKINTGPFNGQLIWGYNAFSEKVSNGIYNDFTIKLKSGKEEKYYFQIDHKRKMLEATGELKKYVDEGLLSYENFVEINR